jgi:hypothetical protein
MIKGGVSAIFVLINWMLVVLVPSVYFSVLFETGSSISDLDSIFLTGTVVETLFLGLRLYF